MDTELAARVLLPSMALLFGVLGLLWPTVRLWRATGVFALTTRRSDSLAEQLMHVGLILIVAACAAFAAGYAFLGPVALGLPPPGLGRLLLAALFLVGGVTIVLVAQAQMGRSWRIGIDPVPTDLVIGGLYRWVRNPIYTGLLAFLLGFVAVAPTWPTIATWLVCLVLLLIQSRREEAHLAKLHPRSFTAWAARTGRFLPGIGRVRRAP